MPVDENLHSAPVAEEKVNNGASSSKANRKKPKKTAKKTVKQKSSEKTVSAPGVHKTTIEKGGVKVSTKESMGFFLQDLTARRKMALPSAQETVPAAERKQSLIATLDKLFAPVRIVVLILMILMIGGRSKSWMTLGFLAGASGVRVLTVLTLVALAAAWQSVIQAVRDIVYFRFSYETILLFSTLIGMFDLITVRNEGTYFPFIVMAWCLSGMAASMSCKGHINGLRGLIKAKKARGVYVGKRRYEKGDVIGKAAPNDYAFVRHQQDQDVWHWSWSLFGLGYFVLTAAVSVLVSVKVEMGFFTVFTNLLSVSAPVGMLLCCGRPYYMLSRCLNGQGVLAGWYGARHLSGKRYGLVYDTDLFPSGTVSLSGYKLYGNYDLPTVVSCTVSAISHRDIGLMYAFRPMMEEVGAAVYPVSVSEGMEGGFQAMVSGNRVAIGTFEFANLIGLMPPVNSPKNALYVGINGRLSGAFILKYQVSEGQIRGMRRFTRELGLKTTLATRNFAYTPAFVSRLFQTEVETVSSPKYEVRESLAQETLVYGGKPAGFVFSEGVGAYSRLVGGARRVYRMGKIFTVAALVFALLMLIFNASGLISGSGMIATGRLLQFHLASLILVELCARLAIRR